MIGVAFGETQASRASFCKTTEAVSTHSELPLGTRATRIARRASYVSAMGTDQFDTELRPLLDLNHLRSLQVCTLGDHRASATRASKSL